MHPLCAKELMSKWVLTVPTARPWEQPIDDVRSYFGARIALYFAFFGFYTKALLVPALLGVAMQAYWSARGGIHWYQASVYAFLVPVWAAGFLALWKRERNRLVTSWGILFDEGEMMRPYTKLHNRCVRRMLQATLATNVGQYDGKYGKYDAHTAKIR
eukprot:844267-Prorocentrum_minimum.AAC.1